jgi:hypothetical protein
MDHHMDYIIMDFPINNLKYHLISIKIHTSIIPSIFSLLVQVVITLGIEKLTNTKMNVHRSKIR